MLWIDVNRTLSFVHLIWILWPRQSKWKAKKSNRSVDPAYRRLNRVAFQFIAREHGRMIKNRLMQTLESNLYRWLITSAAQLHLQLIVYAKLRASRNFSTIQFSFSCNRSRKQKAMRQFRLYIYNIMDVMHKIVWHSLLCRWRMTF